MNLSQQQFEFESFPSILVFYKPWQTTTVKLGLANMHWQKATALIKSGAPDSFMLLQIKKSINTTQISQ